MKAKREALESIVTPPFEASQSKREDGDKESRNLTET
jgi:hypothetical protein